MVQTLELGNLAFPAILLYNFFFFPPLIQPSPTPSCLTLTSFSTSGLDYLSPNSTPGITLFLTTCTLSWFYRVKQLTAAILHHSCTPEHLSGFWLLSFQVLNSLSCTRDISLFSACCFPLPCHHSSLQLLLDVRKKVKAAYFFPSPWASLPIYFSFSLPHKFPLYRPPGRTDSLCALLLLKQDFCQRSHFLLLSSSVPSVASSRQGTAHVRRSLSAQGWCVACLELHTHIHFYMYKYSSSSQSLKMCCA